MKNRLPLLLTLALATALLATLVGCELMLNPLPDTLQAEVDDAPSHGFEGILVYVDQAGQAPAYYRAGWNDRDSLIPVDSQDLFKIASISKLYIAAAAAKLVQAQTLSLEGTLADYLPELGSQFQYAYQRTLYLDQMLPRKRPKTIPEILSVEEGKSILVSVRNTKHKARLSPSQAMA